MNWKVLLKSASSIRRNWINSNSPPSMYYYDKLNETLKKEFDEVFEEMIDDIQRGYLQEKQNMEGSHETENVKGKFSLVEGEYQRNFNFEIAPKSSGTDKYGRYSNYYLYFNKHVKDTELSRTQSMYLTPEEWDNLMETILNVKR